MSLVFSAITPHPPILIPNIGKDNLKSLESTSGALEKLGEKLKKSKAETVIIISPHGLIQENAFTMNLSPKFKCDFENFGDFSTKKSWNGDVGLTYKIREALETVASLQLMSEENIDHGSSVPLYTLTKNIPEIKIIPLYYSGLSYEIHFKFGQLLGHELKIRKKSIAVIASGDLSHRLTKDAPAGFSPKGKKFDKKLIEYVIKNQPEKILKMDKRLIFEAGECGLRSILILMGILDRMNNEPKLLSYEAPFGVGYLTLDFVL